jgi:hypothetical protein
MEVKYSLRISFSLGLRPFFPWHWKNIDLRIDLGTQHPKIHPNPRNALRASVVKKSEG